MADEVHTIPGDSISQAQKTQDIVAQLYFVSVVCILILALFSAIHKYRWLPSIYFPNNNNNNNDHTHSTNSTRRITNQGWLVWAKSIYSLSMEDVLKESGIDGAIVFCILEMAMYYFGVASLIGIIVVLPFHVMFAPTDVNHTALLKSNPLYTIDNIPEGSNLFIVHLIVTWLLVFIYYIALYQTYLRVLSIRNRFMLITGPSARTVVIHGIPRQWDESELRLYLHDLGIGEVDKVVILRRSFQLEWALNRRLYWLLQLEQLALSIQPPNQLDLLQTQYHPSTQDQLLMQYDLTYESEIEPIPMSSGLYVQLAYWLYLAKTCVLWHRKSTPLKYQHASTQFLAADLRVHTIRRQFTQFSDPMQCAYVMFKHPVSQTIATQVLIHSDLTKLKIDKAPPIHDIQFYNLKVPLHLVWVRSIFVGVCMFFLIFFWAIPVGALSTLINIETLRVLFPTLVAYIEETGWLLSIVEGVLPTLAVSLFMGLLPSIIYLFGQLRGFKSSADTNLFMFTTYFYFQLVNVLLVFTIAGTIFKSLELMIAEPKLIPMLLAQSLPHLSPFFFNLLLLNTFILTPNLLLQVSRICFEYLLPGQSTTLRSLYISSQKPVWYIYELSSSVLMIVIGQVYSLVCPLILPLTLLYTMVTWVIFRYRLMYQVKVQSTQSRLWIYLVHMIHHGFLIFILLMFGILSLRKFYGSIGLIPLIVIHFLMLIWIRAMESRILFVPLDQWRLWQGDNRAMNHSEVQECFVLDGICQGVNGVDQLNIDLGYDNVLLYGELPVPWLPGMPNPITFHRNSVPSTPVSPSSRRSSTTSTSSPNVNDPLLVTQQFVLPSLPLSTNNSNFIDK